MWETRGTGMESHSRSLAGGDMGGMCERRWSGFTGESVSAGGHSSLDHAGKAPARVALGRPPSSARSGSLRRHSGRVQRTCYQGVCPRDTFPPHRPLPQSPPPHGPSQTLPRAPAASATVEKCHQIAALCIFSISECSLAAGSKESTPCGLPASCSPPQGRRSTARGSGN